MTAGPNGGRDINALTSFLPFVLRQKGLAATALVSLLVASAGYMGTLRYLSDVVDVGIIAEKGRDLPAHFLILGTALTITAAGTGVRHYSVAQLGERVATDIRTAVHATLLEADIPFFETNRPSDLVSRMTTDLSLVQVVLTSTISVIIQNAILLTGAVAILIATGSWRLLLTEIALVPLIVLLLMAQGKKVRRLSRQTQDSLATLGSVADQTFEAIQIVRAFTAEAIEKARFADAAKESLRSAGRLARSRGMMNAMLIFLIFGTLFGVLWQAANDVLAGRMTTGQLLTFAGASAVVAVALASLSDVAGELQRAAGGAARLKELMTIRPAPARPARPCGRPAVPGTIAFEGVSFRYPSRPDDLALDQVSFLVEPRSSVAIVGPSGSGKSTLLKLLLRFYDQDGGRILLGGEDHREVDPAALRSLISYVPQDCFLFADTVGANIAYGAPGAGPKAVREAARAAGAADFIEKLPDGYETRVGEKGARLSGGQRQRISIARALLRDAPILLLDEATSSLDSESEQDVQRGLNAIRETRTTIVIAHRLSTILSSDTIVVLDNGRVMATGRHDDLMRQDGLYRDLTRLQFISHPLPA